MKNDKLPIMVNYLNFISKRLKALFGIKIRAIGLSVGQGQILLVLHKNNLMTVSAIANVIGVRPSTVSKMSDRLVTSSLIERVGDPIDGRRTRIKLTSEGVLKKAHIERLMKEIERDLIAGLGNNAEQVIRTMNTMDDVLSRKLRRMR